MREAAAQRTAGELALHVYELFNARDLDRLLALAAPDIEWDWSRSIGPDNGIHHGPAAVGRFVAAAWEHWERIEMLPQETIEAGDQIVVMVRVRLRGRDGIEVEASGPHVQTWQEGRLARYRLFQERDEALAAVGL